MTGFLQRSQMHSLATSHNLVQTMNLTIYFEIKELRYLRKKGYSPSPGLTICTEPNIFDKMRLFSFIKHLNSGISLKGK